jgi:hypothetical protein
MIPVVPNNTDDMIPLFDFIVQSLLIDVICLHFLFIGVGLVYFTNCRSLCAER